MQTTIVALFALVAIASAGVLEVPSAYNLQYVSPYAAQYSPLAYNYGYNYGYSPLVAPLTYAAAPIPYSAPAIQSGYVAATRGSLHTAPLPEGLSAFSHHINTAPAPGTL